MLQKYRNRMPGERMVTQVSMWRGAMTAVVLHIHVMHINLYMDINMLNHKYINQTAWESCELQLMQLMQWCRLWPTAHSFQPKLLDSVTRATVRGLVNNDCKVFWAPACDMSARSSIQADLTGGGKWVSGRDACFVQPGDQKATEVIINVGRRAGLNIPEVPSHIFEVSIAECA